MEQNVGGNIPPEIRKSLEHVDFPVSKTELVDQIGTSTVNVGGKSLNWREVLGKVQKDRFQSQDELIREISNLPEMKSMGGQTTGQQTGAQRPGSQTGTQSGSTTTGTTQGRRP